MKTDRDSEDNDDDDGNVVNEDNVWVMIIFK